MNNALKTAIVAVAVLAAVLVVRSVIGAKDAEWQSRVERVTTESRANLAAADIARLRADDLQELADSLMAESVKRDTVIVTRIKNLPAPPPDCEPFTIPRDEIIIDLRKQKNLVATAFARERQASTQLRMAEAGARRSADSLLAVLDDRPRPVSPLIPALGIGATAGICTTGQPCMAVGLTLSWKLELF